MDRYDPRDVSVAQTLISEVGVDMTRWQTEAHFPPGSGCVQIIASPAAR